MLFIIKSKIDIVIQAVDMATNYLTTNNYLNTQLSALVRTEKWYDPVEFSKYKSTAMNAALHTESWVPT